MGESLERGIVLGGGYLLRGGASSEAARAGYAAIPQTRDAGTRAGPLQRVQGEGQQGCGAHPVGDSGGAPRLGQLAGADYEGVTRYESKTASTPRSALSSARSDFTSPSSATYQFFASWSSTAPP